MNSANVALPKALDFTKPLKTRDGREVRIYVTDAEGTYSIVGGVKGLLGATTWTKTGNYRTNCKLESDLDLVQAPQKREFRGYVAIFRDGGLTNVGTPYIDIYKNSPSVAAIKELTFTYEEGEGRS